MATARLHRGLVAISASAVAAVYMAGYLRTRSADASIGAAVDSAANVTLAAAAPTFAPRVQPTPQPGAAGSAAPSARAVGGGALATPTPAGRASPSAPPAAAAQAQAPAAVVQLGYKDGAYTGEGSSRRGGVVVKVVVQGGRIASVTITSSTLQYPVRDIAGLPAQVVARQSAQVDTVSRATYSSQAFRGAVSQALSKAV